jgi:hypothetical protein
MKKINTEFGMADILRMVLIMLVIYLNKNEVYSIQD